VGGRLPVVIPRSALHRAVKTKVVVTDGSDGGGCGGAFPYVLRIQ